MLREIFEKNRKIVINSDIDGFLSGMILQKYYDCKVVGFSNSKDKVWLSDECTDIYSPVYIDLYVNNPDTVCIEQHILAYNLDHLRRLRAYVCKINPNNERGNNSFLDDYYHKYPFGTVHYIMALMEREGIQVQFPDLSCEQSLFIDGREYRICPGQILMRADDAMYSTIGPYHENAEIWWHWLNPNGNYQSLNRIQSYLNSCDSIQEASQIKTETNYFFINAFNCSGGDGAFNEITTINGDIKLDVLKYLRYISSLMNMKLDVPNKYHVHCGEYQTRRLNSLIDLSPQGRNVFSYAIIASPRGRYNQLSYTLDMN